MWGGAPISSSVTDAQYINIFFVLLSRKLEKTTHSDVKYLGEVTQNWFEVSPTYLYRSTVCENVTHSRTRRLASRTAHSTKHVHCRAIIDNMIGRLDPPGQRLAAKRRTLDTSYRRIGSLVNLNKNTCVTYPDPLNEKVQAIATFLQQEINYILRIYIPPKIDYSANV